MNVTCPGFLWLLPLVVAVWFVPRGRVEGRRPLLRSLVLVALIVGLARPVLLQRTWRDYQKSPHAPATSESSS